MTLEELFPLYVQQGLGVQEAFARAARESGIEHYTLADVMRAEKQLRNPTNATINYKRLTR